MVNLFVIIAALIALLVAFSPLIAIVVVIVVLVKNHNNKKNTQATTAIAAENGSPATNYPTVAPPATPPKPKDNNGGINMMLLAGCLLLVFGIIKFLNDTNDKLVAPTAIILTLAFYALGYAIYKKVNYLKIVGTAFSYISLVIFPFWTLSFNSFGMSMRSAWILASFITFCALLLTTTLYKSKPLSYITYLWMFPVVWACTPDSSFSHNIDVSLYWFFISGSLVSLVPTVLWKMKPDWLPVYFRKATQIFSSLFMPAMALFSLILLFAQNSLTTFPFLRTIMAVLVLGWACLYWSIDRAHNWQVGVRFAVQALLLAITMDSLNYSIIELSYFGNPINDSSRLIVVTVWLVSFLIQTILSLFAPKKDEIARKAEHAAEIISLVGIFATPIFTAGLADPLGTIVNLIICGVVAALGIAYTIGHKNSRWSIATVAALYMARLVIASSAAMSESWGAWSDLVYFTLVSGIIVVMYQFFRKYSEKETFSLTVVELVITLLAVISSSLRAEFAEIGWLAAALYLALLGFMSKQTVLYEASIYSGAFCLYSLVGTIGEFMLPNSVAKCVTGPLTIVQPCSGYEAAGFINWIAGVNVIRSFIIGLALTIVSFIKERHLEKDKQIRFYIGYFIMSLGLFLVGTTAGNWWMLFCLAVQVAYLIYASIHDISWLVWVTIIAMLFCAFCMTGGFTYIWFAVLGLTLIGAVVWRLSKLNRAKLAEEAKKTK